MKEGEGGMKESGRRREGMKVNGRRNKGEGKEE